MSIYLDGCGGDVEQGAVVNWFWFSQAGKPYILLHSTHQLSKQSKNRQLAQIRHQVEPVNVQSYCTRCILCATPQEDKLILERKATCTTAQNNTQKPVLGRVCLVTRENDVTIAFQREFFVYTHSLVGVAADDRVPYCDASVHTRKLHGDCDSAR